MIVDTAPVADLTAPLAATDGDDLPWVNSEEELS